MEICVFLLDNLMDNSLVFGWEEWVSLPKLGLPAIKAKIDTGARTSSLHAFDIETFGSNQNPHVRFMVHPVPGRTDLVIPCSAPIVDRREITSSNGESELRYVIETEFSVNGRAWSIEITLTNRLGMTMHMLVGRQALLPEITINASERYCQPELNYDLYHSTKAMRESAVRRALRVAILSRENNYANYRLIAAGEARGHTVEKIDTNRCYMAINAMPPEVHYDGARLPRFDAVIPRIGSSITPYLGVLRVP